MIPVVVAAGDTLSGIAAQYGTSYQAIASASPGVSNPNLIYAGETVYVPSGGSVTGWTPAPEAAPVQQQSTPTPSPASTSFTPAPVASGGGALDDVPGVPSGFAACVAFRESTNGTNPAANGNVYGIIPASGVNVEGASLATQKAAFAQLYAEDGAQPWAPSDGC